MAISGSGCYRGRWQDGSLYKNRESCHLDFLLSVLNGQFHSNAKYCHYEILKVRPESIIVFEIISIMEIGYEIRNSVGNA